MKAKLKRLLKNWRGRLPLLGTILLLISFVVREVLRDAEKDREGTIERVESEFRVRSDIHRLGKKFDEFESFERHRKLLDPDSLLDAVAEGLDDLKLVVPVLETLPSASRVDLGKAEQSLERRYGDLKKDVNEVQLNVVGFEMAKAYRFDPRTTAKDESEADELGGRISELTKRILEARDESRSLVERSIASAREARERSTLLTNVYTWATFVLGALLSLIGYWERRPADDLS